MYHELIETNKQAIQRAKATVRKFTFLRLLVFVLFATLTYFTWGKTTWVVSSVLLGITSFLVAVRFSVDAKLILEKAVQKKKLLEQESLALEGDFSGFDSGKEFFDSKHAFAHDLDLFVSNGIFAQLNRTFSSLGKQRLADHFLQGSFQVEKMNEQVKYLSNKIDWTFNYRVAGSIPSRQEAVQYTVDQWTKKVHSNPTWVNWTMWLIPIIMIPSLIAFNLNLLSPLIFSFLLLAALYPTGKLMKSTNQWTEEIHKLSPKIDSMREQMEFIRQLENAPKSIIELQQLFFEQEKNAVLLLKKWKTIEKRFEFRMNILISIPLNAFFAWDLRQRKDLLSWKKAHASSLETWEKLLAEMEIAISGATFLHNHPSLIFAEFSETFQLEMDELGHPLLLHKKGITNPLKLHKDQQFMILTGPNMAGKSTYLRSVGLAFVLAQAGFPIAAKKALLPKVKLYSSMRTADDLAQESSYFHAELMRLKFILNAIEKGENVFILLDEILKGTNSKDKAEGSQRFLQKLERLGTHGIIATHDLSLCELAKNNPHFFNGCFDSTIEGNELYFDYTWKQGICQNMNASFLLKHMNLVD